MLVLLWIAVFLLIITLGLYLIWAVRDSQISPRTVRTTFFGGALAFVAIFVAFTWHTMLKIPQATHQEQLTPSVRAGKLAWQKYLCVDCHTILGNGAYYAADLTRAWPRFVERTPGDERAVRAAMVAFLRNPPRATRTRRGMPAVVSDADAQSLVDFLKWTSEIDTNGWPPQPTRAAAARTSPSPAPPPMPGREQFVAAGCPACHSIGGGVVVGPDLKGVASRYDRDMLRQWIQDPAVLYARNGAPLNPGFPEMPALSLSDEQARQIADYLVRAGGDQ